jgi:hypothetical protein
MKNTKLLQLLFITILLLALLCAHIPWLLQLMRTPIDIVWILAHGYSIEDVSGRLDNLRELMPLICVLVSDMIVLTVLLVKIIKCIVLNHTEFITAYRSARKKRLERALEKLNKTDTAPD